VKGERIRDDLLERHVEASNPHVAFWVEIEMCCSSCVGS
jgi:hypothetical protein